MEGQLTASGHSFGIVVSRFNSLVTKQVLDSALDCLQRHGASEKDITIVHSPGSFEIPQIALRLARSNSVDGIICLGCVIRGETPHFDYLASEVAKETAEIAIQTGVPVAFGVLTTENLAQALPKTNFANQFYGTL